MEPKRCLILDVRSKFAWSRSPCVRKPWRVSVPAGSGLYRAIFPCYCCVPLQSPVCAKNKSLQHARLTRAAPPCSKRKALLWPTLELYTYVHINIYIYTTFPDKPVSWIASLFRGLMKEYSRNIYIYIYIYIYTHIYIVYFFKLRCYGIQIQNRQASCRQPHSKPTEKAASPAKKDKQQLSVPFRMISF